MDREDYFFGDTGLSARKTIYALVIYDIVDNKRRLKLAKFLAGYGDRIQKSAFEVRLSENKFNKLKNKLPAYCSDEDSIRLYKLSGRSEVTKWGIDNSSVQEDVILI